MSDTIKTQTETDETTNRTVLEINGELTVKNMSYLKNQVLETLNNTDNLLVKLKDIESLDIAGIQLLIAAEKTATSNNKSIAFETTLPDKLSGLMENTGFDPGLSILS